MLEQIHDTIERFKAGLREYCLKKCEDNCCSFTSYSLSGMWVSEDQLEAILKCAGVGDIEPEIGRMQRGQKLRKKGKQYRLQNFHCPAHDSKTKKCGLYGNPNRPSACGDFPLWWDEQDEFLEADLRCPYMREYWEDLLNRLEENHPEILQEMEVRFSHFPLMCERVGKADKETIAQRKEVVRKRIKKLPSKRK